MNMPPFSTSLLSSSSSSSSDLKQFKPESYVVAIDVGGKLFQTTKQTLTQAGPNSLFSRLSECYSSVQSSPPFIDRDPELFSVLLSLLRTGYLPSKAKTFDLQDLISESQFYGVESILVNSLSHPSQFDAFNLEKTLVLPLNGRETPSAIATTPHGSIHVAHGSKITSFDWSLRRKSTILTQFAAVDSLLALSPSVAAAGATDFSGLQILDLKNGSVKWTLNWENVTKSSSTVQAIGSSPEFLFASFESGRRNSNSIMIYDLHSLCPVSEIGQNEIFGAEIDSAIPATKLTWISGNNLLMASGSHSGPSGVFGNIKFWDVRANSVVCEMKEKSDCFSDITASDNLAAIFKVGVNSGQVFYGDLRKVGDENPWVCLGDGRKPANGKKEGAGSKIRSHGNQVLCSKGGDIELWSEVGMSPARSEDGVDERVFRKNVVGRAREMGGSRITRLAIGGNKLFLTRKDEQSVEVWQTCGKGFS